MPVVYRISERKARELMNRGLLEWDKVDRTVLIDAESADRLFRVGKHRKAPAIDLRSEAEKRGALRAELTIARMEA